jgi:hypothetical protein
LLVTRAESHTATLHVGGRVEQTVYSSARASMGDIRAAR